MIEDDVNDGIYISDIDLVVAIHITVHIVVAAQDDVNDCINISNVDFTIAVDIALQSIFHLNDMGEFSPNMVILISCERPFRHIHHTGGFWHSHKAKSFKISVIGIYNIGADGFQIYAIKECVTSNFSDVGWNGERGQRSAF